MTSEATHIRIPDWALQITDLRPGELLVLGVIVSEYRGRDHATVGMRGIATRLGGRDRTRVREWYRRLIELRLVRVIGRTPEGYSKVVVVRPTGGEASSPRGGAETPGARGPQGGAETPGVKGGGAEPPLKKVKRVAPPARPTALLETYEDENGFIKVKPARGAA